MEQLADNSTETIHLYIPLPNETAKQTFKIKVWSKSYNLILEKQSSGLFAASENLSCSLWIKGSSKRKRALMFILFVTWNHGASWI